MKIKLGDPIKSGVEKIREIGSLELSGLRVRNCSFEYHLKLRVSMLAKLD